MGFVDRRRSSTGSRTGQQTNLLVVKEFDAHDQGLNFNCTTYDYRNSMELIACNLN